MITYKLAIRLIALIAMHIFQIDSTCKSNSIAIASVIKSCMIKEISDSTNEEIRRGITRFELKDKELHPEGIAYSNQTHCFYISSVRKGIIIKIDSTGSSSQFAQPEPRQSIMGLQTDDEKGILWACAVSAPHLKYNNAEEIPAALLKIDLITGAIIKRYKALHARDWLGDLAITSKGEVFVSNSSSNHPSVYKLDQQTEKLEVLFESGELTSVQGLSFNHDETMLFFSDYIMGLFIYDLETRKIHEMRNETTHPVVGIDGLYYFNKSLLAIQNGIRPFAILQLFLHEENKRIVSIEYLERGISEMNEPTLGTMVGSGFYYIANSPWNAYNRENELLLHKTDNPVIRKIDLP